MYAKASFIVLIASLAATSPASARYVVKDKSYTAACYEAASLQRYDGVSLSACTRALVWEVTTDGQERAGTLVNRGILRALRHDFEAAKEDYQSALEIDPTAAEAWLGLASVHWKAGDSAKALNAVDRAIAAGTARPALAYLIRGLAHEDRGEYRAALEDLNMSQRLDPDWAAPKAEISRYRIVRR